MELNFEPPLIPALVEPPLVLSRLRDLVAIEGILKLHVVFADRLPAVILSLQPVGLSLVPALAAPRPVPRLAFAGPTPPLLLIGLVLGRRQPPLARQLPPPLILAACTAPIGPRLLARSAIAPLHAWIARCLDLSSQIHTALRLSVYSPPPVQNGQAPQPRAACTFPSLPL